MLTLWTGLGRLTSFLFSERVCGGFVCSFPIGAVTDHHQFRGSKQHKFTALWFWRSEVQNVSRRLTSSCQPSRVPSGSCSLPLAASRGWLHFLGSRPLPLPSRASLILCVCHHSFSSDWPSRLLCKGPCDYNGPTWITRGPLPSSRFLTKITCEFPFPM